MRTKLRLIDKYRRSSWLQGGDRYFFVLRVEDGLGKDSKIYERRVTRQCYYRFEIDEFLYSNNPAAKQQLAQPESDVF